MDAFKYTAVRFDIKISILLNCLVVFVYQRDLLIQNEVKINFTWYSLRILTWYSWIHYTDSWIV